ncbi:MAG: hypothetical protein ACJAZP_000279 [Psychromonas sp.]|jgi:hypothetical protein|uniref:EF-hand domain-containing protein n=1 Tax=Psychromonas sp. TaxID=1884585 RepID=UPI0039E46044
MKISSKTIIAMVVGLAVSSQIYAADGDQSRGDMPPPPPKFTSVDTNSDNQISLEEFSTQELPHGDYQTIFSEMDSNSDGVVSKAEFEAFKPPRPER